MARIESDGDSDAPFTDDQWEGLMAGLLISRVVADRCEAEFARVQGETDLTLELIIVPEVEGVFLEPEDLARVEIAFFSGDMLADEGTLARRFFGAALRAPNLKWMHASNAGIDDPVFGRVLEAGARLSNSSGSSAEPIAQTAIGGMLALSRGFPAWGDAQRDREWRPLEQAATPADLGTQTVVVVGLGAIGGHIARLSQALGLHVIGVRRSPQRPGDPVDEMVTPADLASVLPRADWLALAMPLTDETRDMISAEAIALLPKGARILNVARGQVIDEGAMIDALRSGALGGAYLDVFDTEPLPSESPLWELPNVIVTPHNSSASLGNNERSTLMFLTNLDHWARDEPLENEVSER